ncbi:MULTISPECIES: hypothetical protein [unclassified Mesorhizobium]|uniref:hypothetical protein n=1 Tax=unclassified Mesorhizobium TaxID=325217 RepID=UPI000FCA9658|nr:MULTISPECIES: hypothetical protein [unclassified Mesorhizobium]TGP24892.1 hypothetical protein EN874_007110 [Mesorhizobium sp. M1D.F.Ca.ET.231.01.1.1]TGP36215.1 hypothetical protein EN877_07110 [Mesorhizobium sp. M1D.F.Ca.ET.234.01.1.1]TGS49717.1 hypothetical protein EN827_07110 [Mesorhizobium sp. M1D.F.Ca.ET.184.01.1.1]TGS64429.1 hypothetical protein EN826_007110 [Mesorhizobium sp. M1D.F.Ca.ET.183.01.1.1]
MAGLAPAHPDFVNGHELLGGEAIDIVFPEIEEFAVGLDLLPKPARMVSAERTYDEIVHRDGTRWPSLHCLQNESRLTMSVIDLAAR